MFVRNSSIRLNLTLLILFASGLAVLLASFGFGIYERANYRSSAVRELTALADTLGANSAASVAFDDKKTAQEILGALATEPHVLLARLYDNDGKGFAEYRNRNSSQNGFILSGLRPDGAYFDRKSLALFRGVLLNGQRTGSIALVFDMGDLRSQLLEYVKIATLVLLLSVLVTFVASLRVTASIGAPFVQLAAVARQVSTEKDYSVRAKAGAGGEAGLLIRSFNEMLSQIESSNNQLRQHREKLEEEVAFRTSELVASTADLRESENKYRVLFEDSADAFWLMDDKGFVDCNSAALQLFGFDSKAEFKHPADISPPTQSDGRSSRAAAEERMSAAFVKGKEQFEWLHRRKNGELFHSDVCLAAITLRGRRMLLATARDITDRKVAEERVQFLAYYDALTGLPNRTLLEDRISKALASARRRKEGVAVLFLDLDRFKIINDTLGHSTGDMLLQEVAARLKRWAREQDTLARVGGDEFVVLLTGITQASDAAVAAQRVVDAVTAEFSLKGNPINITCSIGISMFPENGMDGETLVKNAGTSMYCAKQKGPNNIQFFTKDMNDQMVERLTLESGLRLALDRQELFLVYQPQMDIATGEIVGVEALLRWQLPEVQIAVNVSAVQFRQDGFRDHIRSVLHETGLASQYLELELTESLLLSNADVMFSVLRELKEMGLSLAIDDFGTGYSSLSYLRQFPVSKLKIDRSFIQDVAINPDDAAITAAIISMAKNLNLRVIAEGVENEAQLSFLRAHQCDELQGYYFSRPLSADKVADMLRGNKIEFALSPRRAETINFGMDSNAHTSVTDRIAS
jgi:diguanylate cyclase (GGDEF)-like protein/PAS domain S-box-containing protein